jgi:hypothetical protein
MYGNNLFSACESKDDTLLMDVLRTYSEKVTPLVERDLRRYFSSYPLGMLESIQDDLNRLQKTKYSKGLGDFYFLISSIVREMNTSTSYIVPMSNQKAKTRVATYTPKFVMVTSDDDTSIKVQQKKAVSRPKKVQKPKLDIDSPLPVDPVADCVNRIIDSISVSYSLALSYFDDYESCLLINPNGVKNAVASYPLERLTSLNDELGFLFEQSNSQNVSHLHDIVRNVIRQRLLFYRFRNAERNNLRQKSLMNRVD